jgi:hypothetical protein
MPVCHSSSILPRLAIHSCLAIKLAKSAVMVKKIGKNPYMIAKKTTEFYTDFQSIEKEFLKIMRKSYQPKGDIRMNFCLQKVLA